MRSSFEHSFVLDRPLEESFTFFEPIGEKRWAEQWQPQFPTPADARLHNGTVFTVERPNPEGGEAIQSAWTITRYAPPREIEYHNVLVGRRTTRISVSCEPVSDHAARVTVRYVYVGLSPAGDRAIGEISASSYAEMIEGWRTAILAYLARGTPASP